MRALLDFVKNHVNENREDFNFNRDPSSHNPITSAEPFDFTENSCYIRISFNHEHDKKRMKVSNERFVNAMKSRFGNVVKVEGIITTDPWARKSNKIYINPDFGLSHTIIAMKTGNRERTKEELEEQKKIEEDMSSHSPFVYESPKKKDGCKTTRKEDIRDD